MKRTLLAAALLLPSLAALGQNHDDFDSAFLHRRVWLKVDMPGTQLGVDLRPEQGEGLPGNYSSLLQQYPLAYRAGDSATVSKVVFKKDHIEFQLDHGGYGQFGDNTDVTPVPWAPLPPSPDELRLRERIEHEPDPRDRRREQDHLDDLVRQRFAMDAQNKLAADQATQAKIQAVADRRAHGGSRFNINYNGHVPESLTPRDLEVALDRVLSFAPLGPDRDGPRRPEQGYRQQQGYPQQPGYTPQSAPMQGYVPDPGQRPAQPTAQDYYPQQSAPGGPPQSPQASQAASQLQKGMTIEQVEQLLGPPANSSASDTQYGRATTQIFVMGNQTITVNYMDGVLTRYGMKQR
jgi:hypothetical protein